MDGALDWIGQIIQWIGRFIPRIVIVRATHAGVKFQRGKKVKPIAPGLTVYWPLITELELIPVARQTHNLPTQCAVTKDREAVAVGGVVIYSISNVVKALSRNWDFNDTINDVALTAIMPEFLNHTYSELIKWIADGSIQTTLTLKVREKLSHYGIRVIHVGLTDFAKCFVLKSVGDAHAHTIPIRTSVFE